MRLSALPPYRCGSASHRGLSGKRDFHQLSGNSFEGTAGMRNEREARARFLLGLLLADIYKDECAAELLRDAIYYMPDMVAAHVELGIAYCGLEKYRETVRAFQQAIDSDVEAVRAAVRDEPEELDRLRRTLYPDRLIATGAQAGGPAVPGYVSESWALVGLGREHLASGRDGQAIAALEAALKLDGTHPYAVALLALTHLLMRQSERDVGTGGVLRKLKPRLAKLIFES